MAPGCFHVTPDGTVIAGVGWDEGGRNIGLHKDGKVNHRLVAQYDMRGGHDAWGFGSSAKSLTADENYLYAANSEGDLMRFRWVPGQLDSHQWLDQLELGESNVPRSLSASGGKLAALFDDGKVIVWQVSPENFTRSAEWQAPANAKQIALMADGSAWFHTGVKVGKVTATGQAISTMDLTDAGSPSAISISPKGGLIVCDNGPRQQLRLYDVSGAAPKLVKTVGAAGGLRSGTAGEPGPLKLYALAGAGMDSQGNVYVACCQHVSSRGTSIRSLSPAGKINWHLECHAFTDGYTFDPKSDGEVIVGADEIIHLDLSKPPGQEWSLKALTLDPTKYPNDPRLGEGHPASTGYLRYVGGQPLLYTIGMQSGGFNLFAFEEGGSQITMPAGSLTSKNPHGGGWAWHVDATGNIWCGDTKDGSIKSFPFVKWEGGKPVFDVQAPKSWPKPTGLRQICRVHYDPAGDILYIGGYPDGVKEKHWGAVGTVLRRYNAWSKGNATKAWEIALPHDDQEVPPKAMDIAGDYAFIVAVKPSAKRDALVTVYKTSDGSKVGEIWPGATVGGHSGWVDITHAIHAHRRKDGEYLILVEEDFRGKNILYRWKP